MVLVPSPLKSCCQAESDGNISNLILLLAWLLRFRLTTENMWHSGRRQRGAHSVVMQKGPCIKFYMKEVSMPVTGTRELKWYHPEMCKLLEAVDYL